MIVDIKKGNFAKGLINYHEKKVEKGRGELIQDSTFSRNKEQRIAEFLDIKEYNPAVKKDIYTHISVSFSNEDKVSRDQQLQIAERYLEGMGYGNSPRLIYEHWDTKHRHFHIVTSAIDLNGKKVNIFRDHYRSQELSREIEKDFGLTVTQYSRQEATKLQEINASKFKLLKGFEKLINDPDAQESLSQIIKPDELDKIVTEKLSDKDIESLLKLRDVEERQFNQLYRIIRQFDAEYKTEKEQLRDRLNYIKGISRTRDEFYTNVERQGIYVRKIASGPTSFNVTYGIKDKNFYVIDKDLPVALRYDYLFTGKQIGKTFDEDSQRKFLQRIVSRSLKLSANLNDFDNNLARAGVTVEYNENARGIYGVSFKSNQIKDAITFKGSDIGISWNRISKDLSIPKAKIGKAPETKPTLSDTAKPIVIPKNIGKSLDTSNDDEEKREKRKNRDQDMDRD